MNVVLAGQKTFGREALKLIRSLGHQVVAAACPADGQDKLHIAAMNAGVPVIPSGKLNAQTIPEGVDLIVAAHSHDFIGRLTRGRARIGAIGFHPSLLPLHRGRDAIRWAIKMGDRVTGGSIYWLTDTVDAGPTAAQDWCFVRPEDDARSLWERELMPMGLRLYARVLRDLSERRMVKVDQDDALATWEPAMEGQPRIYRPDLPQIGNNGFEIVRDRDLSTA